MTVIRRTKHPASPPPKAVPVPVTRSQPAKPAPPRKEGSVSACCQAYAADLKKARRSRQERRAAERKSSKIKDIKRPERLPNLSKFEVTYDVATEMWSGRLLVTEGDAPQEYTGSANAVFKLLADLDRQYRTANATDRAS